MTAEVDRREVRCSGGRHGAGLSVGETVVRSCEAPPRGIGPLIQTPLANLPNVYTKSRTAEWKDSGLFFSGSLPGLGLLVDCHPDRMDPADSRL